MPLPDGAAVDVHFVTAQAFGAHFCGGCGNPVPKICPNCGTLAGDGDRFCARCGNRLV